MPSKQEKKLSLRDQIAIQILPGIIASHDYFVNGKLYYDPCQVAYIRADEMIKMIDKQRV